MVKKANSFRLESLMNFSDYSNSLKYAYAKTFNNVNAYHHYMNRVSLRDIGVRQPVVHFDLDYLPYKNGFGSGGGSTMSSVYTVRKISEDLARKRLTDVDEADENHALFYGTRKYSTERRASSGSVLSDSSRKSSSDESRKKKSSDYFDMYWDLRRLSEAGVRRSSDASVVLTEDTDSFIIGDRVWVGGTKSGQIAYIGETQFAPGDWAGIVLDEPVGKNDGSVANIRYFQCEPKKGVFSRLTRLTRYPLLGAELLDYPGTPIPPLESRASNGSITTPLAKKSSITSSTPSARNSVTKPPSPDSPSVYPPTYLKIGDRVIVMSGQGSKAGVLRFIGPTDFAAGEWCGVELDDPLGKNDGSVAGTRYFDCRAKFGLFAPSHKVSKSPSSRRPSSATCQIHKGGGSLRKHGSKESLISQSSVTSNATSVKSGTARKIGTRTPTTPTSTKNALQDTLKEKELHIEQLLKERDLERAEITRAASQADEAERKLAVIKLDYEQRREDAEARILDCEALIARLQVENRELVGQVEDERRKVEDIQFRLEEETIDKGDMKATNESLQVKIKSLQSQLSDEKKKIDVADMESNKLFETEEQLMNARVELEEAKEQWEKEKVLRTKLEQDRISVEATLAAAKAEVESVRIELAATKSTASKDESKIKEDMFHLVNRLETMNKDLQEKDVRLHAVEQEKMKVDETLRRQQEAARQLEKQVSDTKKQLQESTIEASSLKKNLELNNKGLVEKMAALEAEIAVTKTQLVGKEQEVTIEVQKRNEIEDKLQAELKDSCCELLSRNEMLERVEQKNKQLTGEIDKMVKELSYTKQALQAASESSDKQVIAMGDIVNKLKNELETMQDKLSNKGKDLEKLQAEHEVRLDEQNCRIASLENNMKKKEEECSKLLEEMEMNKARLEEMNKNSMEEMGALLNKKNSQINDLENAIRTSNSQVEQLRTELSVWNSKHEEKDREVKSLMETNEDLKKKVCFGEESNKKLKEEFNNLQLEFGDLTRKLKTAEDKAVELANQKNKLENDISHLMNSSNDSSVQLGHLNSQLREKEKDLDSMREENRKLTNNYERNEQELEQTIKELQNKITGYEDRIKDDSNKYEKKLEEVNSKLQSAVDHNKEVELQLLKKLDDAVAEYSLKISDYEDKVNSIEKSKTELKVQHSEQVQKLEKLHKDLECKLRDCEREVLETKQQLEDLKLKNKSAEEANAEKIEKLLRDQKEKANSLSEIHQTQTNQLSQKIDLLNQQIEEKNQILDKLNSELCDSKENKNRINEGKIVAENNVKILQINYDEIEKKKDSLDKNLTKLKQEYEGLLDKYNNIQVDKQTLENNVRDKDELLLKLRNELEMLSEYRKLEAANADESQGKIHSLTEQVNKLNDVVLDLQKQKEINEKLKDTQIHQLLEDVTIYKQRLTDSSLNNESNIKQIQKLSNINDKLNLTIKENEHNYTMKCEQLSKSEKSLQVLKLELDSEVKKAAEFGKRLNISETERIDLKERYELLEKQFSSNTDVNVKLVNVSEKLQESRRREEELINNSKLERETLEKMLETSNSLLSQREREAEITRKEIETLRKELSTLKSNKSLVDNLERDKKHLEQKVVELQTQFAESQVNANVEDASHQLLLDEKEMTKNQVDFLNSVIVDMQQKNDTLKKRIEILEMGLSPDDVDDIDLDIITSRRPAPRLFCDICDRFDVHDTEDCPTQAMDDDQPPPKVNKPRQLPPERPYCYTCEMFGHDTAQCDDAETF